MSFFISLVLLVVIAIITNNILVSIREYYKIQPKIILNKHILNSIKIIIAILMTYISIILELNDMLKGIFLGFTVSFLVNILVALIKKK